MTYRYRRLPIDHPNRATILDGFVLAVIVLIAVVACLAG